MIALIEPYYPKGEGGRPAYPLMAMLRVHLMQNWFGYSDPAMEEALYETTILRQFSGLSLERIPDETTILNFRRLLEKHELATGILGVINGYLGDRGLSLRQGTLVDATLIHAPSSTKNKDGKRDPEMHQTKKGNQYYFGANAHIGADDESGLVHSVVVTAANVADVTQVAKLLHGEENVVCADAGTPGSRSAKNTLGARSFGRLPPAAALTTSTENAVFCTRRSAKSRRPRPRFAPRSSIRFGSSNASLAMKKCAFGAWPRTPRRW